MGSCIKLIFDFLVNRIDESPVFIFILERALNKVFVTDKFLRNDDNHKDCSIQAPLEADEREYKDTL